MVRVYGGNALGVLLSRGHCVLYKLWNKTCPVLVHDCIGCIGLIVGFGIVDDCLGMVRLVGNRKSQCWRCSETFGIVDMIVLFCKNVSCLNSKIELLQTLAVCCD